MLSSEEIKAITKKNLSKDEILEIQKEFDVLVKKYPQILFDTTYKRNFVFVAVYNAEKKRERGMQC